MLWQTETMWKHAADNAYTVRLSRAAPVGQSYAFIQRQFTHLFVLENQHH